MDGGITLLLQKFECVNVSLVFSYLVLRKLKGVSAIDGAYPKLSITSANQLLLCRRFSATDSNF